MDIKITRELLDTIMFRIGDEVLTTYVAYIQARTDYSGRNMYGKTCIGIVTDAYSGFLLMGLGAILADMEQVEELVDSDGNPFSWFDLNVATDNMGRSMIVYFPNLSIAE